MIGYDRLRKGGAVDSQKFKIWIKSYLHSYKKQGENDKRGFAIISQFNENRLMIIFDASLFKDFFQNVKTYPEACQTSKMDFFLEYSQKLKAVYYFHKSRVKKILNATLECILS